MKRNPGQAAVWFLVSLLLLPFYAPYAEAQNAAPPPTPQQLDQLLAPVALYPDSLLAQITTASTNPQEILDFDNWLAANDGLTGQALADAAQKQGFDPAFLALTTFPRIVEMMAENIDDYAAIGQAVTADQSTVTASIQRLRAQAYNAGNLKTTPQQRVEVQQSAGTTTYVIQPASTQVVYVPVYDPTVVYVRPAVPVAVPLITFGIGIGIGWLVASNDPWGWNSWGWGWGPRGGIYYNRVVWTGWRGGYRPPNPWYRPRPIPWASRPGYGGNWGYRPRNYRPPVLNHPSYNRPGIRPGYRPPPRPGGPGNGRPGGGYPGNGRPGGGNPGNGRPGGGNPGNGRPGGGNPGNGRPGGGYPGNGRPGGPGNGRPGGGNPPGNGRPGGGNGGTTPGRPGGGNGGGGGRPGGGPPGGGNNRPGGGGPPGGNRPSIQPARPSPQPRPAQQGRPQGGPQPR